MPSSAEPLQSPAAPGTWLTQRPVTLRGSAVARWLLRRAGWTLVFDGLPSRQGVFIGYPHTSNWDFILALFFKWGSGFQAHFWAKDSLFKLPVLGAWLRWMGGYPVDRSAPRGMVGSMVDRYRQASQQGDFLWLAITPEGTRAWQPHWRTGFHQLAVQAQVPVGLVFFDYGRKRVGVDHFLALSGDAEADLLCIARYYDGVVGQRPEQAAPVRFK